MFERLTTFMNKLDQKKLWIIGFFFTLLCFLPYIILGEGSVYLWHDQLDENILHYIYPARHLFDASSTYPEMMCGINKSAFHPFGVLFLPLYCIFSNYVAFTIQYAIIFLIAFFGMYALVKETTNSSVLALIAAGCFSLLPFYPICGASVSGIPMCLYAILCLEKGIHKVLSFLLLTLFALTANLVLSGYAVLGLWALWLFICLCRKKMVKESLFGFIFLSVVFVIANYPLFLDYLPGAEHFVSHRTEFIIDAIPFWDMFWDSFFSEMQHANPLHKYLILPCTILIGVGFFFRGKFDVARKKRHTWTVIIFVVIIFIALFAAFFNCEPIVAFRNRSNGFFRYFQLDRFTWLYPALWYFEFALAVSCFWGFFTKIRFAEPIIVLVVLLPTLYLIASKSNIYMNTYELFKGHQYTGYIPWEDYYAEDVMQEIEDTIGEDITSYRVVHLGLCPSPALIHGFYTVDGCSSYYPLEYKHKFRKVVEKEFEKAPDVATYFDAWGSRCYLFNSQSGTSFINSKYSGVTYEGLEIDWALLKSDFNCKYVFSCGPILDYEAQGLEEVGYFTSDHCFWGFNVYKIP